MAQRPPVPYLSELAERSRRRKDFKAIAGAITNHGPWEDLVEWGVGKETTSSIERLSGQMYAGLHEAPGPWYDLSVKCDSELNESVGTPVDRSQNCRQRTEPMLATPFGPRSV